MASTFPIRSLHAPKTRITIYASMVASISSNLSAERNRSDSSNALCAREGREISWKIGGEIPLQTHGQIWNDLAKRPQRLSSRCAFSEAMFQSFARLYAPSRSRLMAWQREKEKKRNGESGREIRDAKHEIYRKLERRATPVRVST